MNKIIGFLLTLALLLPCLLITGCGGTTTTDNSSLTIVTTNFSAYDWTRSIAGTREDVTIILLPENGVDMHSYQPTIGDVITLTSCDLLIHVGGTDDAWIKDALQNASSKPEIINLMETLGDDLKQEEIKDGMEHEHEEESCTDGTHNHGSVTLDNADEHIWLSLKNATVFCRTIADMLICIDPDHADAYEQNVTAYTASLDELDAAYQKAVTEGNRSTLLFADRFPFRYLVDDYGLDYFAAFAGCSADTNASFDTVIYLAEQIDRLQLPCVLVIENSPVNIASGIIQNTQTKDQTILTLNAMQSVTLSQANAGMTYLGVMQKNLDVLTSALN